NKSDAHLKNPKKQNLSHDLDFNVPKEKEEASTLKLQSFAFQGADSILTSPPLSPSLSTLPPTQPKEKSPELDIFDDEEVMEPNPSKPSSTKIEEEESDDFQF